MKKEKHPVYWAVMIGFLLLLALGVALFAFALTLGGDRIILPPGKVI